MNHLKHCETSWNTLKTLWNIMKHLKHCETSWNTQTLPFDATISALDVETSALDAAFAQNFWRYWRGISGNCSVGITPQMCNRVTNHGDMGTFSRPAPRSSQRLPSCLYIYIYLSTEFAFFYQTYIFDIFFGGQMSDQSPCGDYLNSSTFPWISTAFKMNAI